METLTDAIQSFDMDAADNRRLEIVNAATRAVKVLNQIAVRVREILPEGACPNWADMHTALRDIRELIQEAERCRVAPPQAIFPGGIEGSREASFDVRHEFHSA